MADCKAFREEVGEIGDHGLSREASAHLETCGACGALRREREQLRRLVGGLGRVEAPADFEFRLRARMASGRNGGHKHSFFRLHLTPGFAWVAAALCFVAVSASLYLRQEKQRPALVQQIGANEVAKTLPFEKNTVRSETRQSEPDGEAVKKASGGLSTQGEFVVDKARGFRRVSRNTSLRVAGRDYAQVGSDEHSVVGAPLRVKQIRPIRLRTSPETLRFVVRDENGAARSVPMQSVSFGSQEMVAGVNARVRQASSDKGGVW